MTIKPENTKEKYVRVCPKCKSPDVYQDKSTLQQTGMLPVLYICRKCNHSAYIFPEVKLSELKDLIEEVNKEQQKDTEKDKKDKSDKSELVDVAYGNFFVRFWWKITAPLTIIAGIILFFKPSSFARTPIFGLVLFIIGILIFYITYFKKRKLRD